MMCVSRILINITYLLTYLFTYIIKVINDTGSQGDASDALRRRVRTTVLIREQLLVCLLTALQDII